MLSGFLTRDKKQIMLDRLVKFLFDTVLTQIFAYFVIFSVCGSIPHIAETYTTELLFRYTFFFSVAWNILLSSTVISILTITALFASMIGAVVYYAADPAFHVWINGYFQWLSTLFMKYNAPNETYRYVTVMVVTVFFTLMMTFFATRFSNVGLVLFIIIPFSIYYELAGDALGTGYFPTLIFALALYYMRLRQSVYLDYRLSERYAVRFGNMTNVVMLPAFLIALVLTGLVAVLPEDRYASSEANLGLSARLTELVYRAEENLFSTTRDIVYEEERIGTDDGEGVLLNSSRVHTLSVTSYSHNIEYVYLRSYAYRNFDGAWRLRAQNGVEMPGSGAPSTQAMEEITAAMKLIANRARNTYRESGVSVERVLNRMMHTTELAVTYEDIKAKTFFELPLAESYSLLGKNKLTVLDDFNGSGLYASEVVPSGTTYTGDYITLDKSADTVEFYRYFGKGFYDTVTEEEANSVYGGKLDRYRASAERIALAYTDTTGASDRLIAVAQRLYDPEKGEYDNALTIADYLLKHCRYDADVYTEKDGDLNLDRFLFSGRRGNDVHFATAAVLMLRAAGIPARYAEGYLVAAGGDLGEVAVRQKDEHAWAEIYLEGLGWVPIETVPDRGEPATALLKADYGEVEETEDTSVWRELTLGAIARAALRLAKRIGGLLLKGILTIIGLCLLLLLVLLGRNFALRRLAAQDESRESLAKMLKLLFRAAAAAGIRREKDEGMRAYAERLDRVLPTAYRLAPLVDEAYAVSYGKENPSAEAKERLRRILGEYGRYLRALKKGLGLQLLGRLV